MSRFTDEEVISVNRLLHAVEVASMFAECGKDLSVNDGDLGAPIGSLPWLLAYHDGLHDLQHLWDTETPALLRKWVTYAAESEETVARAYARRAAHCAGLAMLIRQGLANPEALTGVKWEEDDAFSAWGRHIHTNTVMRMAEGVTAEDADRLETSAVAFSKACADLGGDPKMFAEFRTKAARALLKQH